jgi:hypothetical protein
MAIFLLLDQSNLFVSFVGAPAMSEVNFSCFDELENDQDHFKNGQITSRTGGMPDLQ